MDDQRGEENPEHRRSEPVPGREGECLHLALITEFSDEDERGGDEEGTLRIGRVARTACRDQRVLPQGVLL